MGSRIEGQKRSKIKNKRVDESEETEARVRKECLHSLSEWWEKWPYSTRFIETMPIAILYQFAFQSYHIPVGSAFIYTRNNHLANKEVKMQHPCYIRLQNVLLSTHRVNWHRNFLPIIIALVRIYCNSEKNKKKKQIQLMTIMYVGIDRLM